MKRRLFALILAAVAAASGTGLHAQATQDYPTRPLRLVVPYPAGGNPDAVARSLSGQLERQFGRPVIVDNRSGASGVIGIEIVAKAVPDGYTMLFATSSIVVNQAVRDKLTYDIERDFQPVTNIGQGAGFLLVVHPSLRAASLVEFLDLARSRERPLAYGSSGMANVSHMMGEMFNLHANTRLMHVPYKGSGPALNALLGGEVQVMFVTPTIGMSPIKAGRLRALGFTGATRWKLMPELPAVAESVPGFQMDAGWLGWFAPARTPPALLARIHIEIVAALQSPRVRDFIVAGGYEPKGDSPEAFRHFVQMEVARFTQIARIAKVKIDPD